MARLSAIGLLLVVAACTVGPEYKPPRQDMPASFSEQQTPGALNKALREDWWKIFPDAELDRLVTMALRGSPDIQQAEGRVREARALAGVAGAALYPTVVADGAYARTHGSDRVPLGVLPGGLGPGIDANVWQAGFDASWEIDIFGGLRRNVQSAEAGYQAAIESRGDVSITLIAEVARNYITMRGAQRRLAVARLNLALQTDTLNLTRLLVAAGLAPGLDTLQAEAQVSDTRASITTIEVEERSALYGLGVLVGRPPEELLTELETPRPIPQAAEEIPVGLPSDLLLRRPDIRAAERRIAAANARIGVATADLYPHFFLTGLGGLQSLHADTFVNPSAGYFSIGPNISWLVFDAGRVRFNIDAERARTDQTVAAYERAVLTALQDVESALVTYGRAEDRRRFLEAEHSENAQAVNVATQLYGQGLKDFIRVLVAEQSLATTDEKLAASETDTALALVALCKALGGGWQ